MLSKSEEKYIVEAGETMLNQIKRYDGMKYWGIEQAIYQPYYMDNNLLCPALIFNIDTEKYNHLNYVRVIYIPGSDYYMIQILKGIERNGRVNDFEVIDQKDREYAFGLASSIEKMI